MHEATQLFFERWNEILNTEDLWALRIELLKRFVIDFPEFGPGWRKLGRTLAELSRFAEADEALQKALRLAKPDDLIWVYTDIGIMSRYKGEHDAAETWFRKAIDHRPDDVLGYAYLGGLFVRLGRHDEAETVYRRGTLCKTGCIDEAYLNLGYILRAVERYDEARECFERALQIDPQYKIARLALRDVKAAKRVIAKNAG